MNLNYIKTNLKLFDELLISEYDLSELVNDYTWKRTYYNNQLRNNGYVEPENLSKIEYDIAIKSSKENIKFRNKHIIFMGYKRGDNNKIFFLQLTSVQKSVYDFPVYYKKGAELKSIYIIVNQLRFAVLDELSNVEYSRYNRNKSNIIQDPA